MTSRSAASPRTTRQRTALLDLLATMDDFRTAQDIHARLRVAGNSVGLATVYRNLAHMAAAGEVDVLAGEDGESMFRMCSGRHHHHLVCRQCGRTVEVAGPTVESWAHRVADEHGYTAVNHTLELFGLCPRCSAAAEVASAAPAQQSEESKA